MEHNANQALALYPHLPPTHTHTHTHTGQKTPSNECQELYKDINFASPFYLPDSSSFPSLSSLPLVLILWQHHLPNGAISSCGTTVVFVLSSYTSHSCFPYAQTSSQIPHPLWPIIFRTSWLWFFFFFFYFCPTLWWPPRGPKAWCLNFRILNGQPHRAQWFMYIVISAPRANNVWATF